MVRVVRLRGPAGEGSTDFWFLRRYKRMIGSWSAYAYPLSTSTITHSAPSTVGPAIRHQVDPAAPFFHTSFRT